MTCSLTSCVQEGGNMFEITFIKHVPFTSCQFQKMFVNPLAKWVNTNSSVWDAHHGDGYSWGGVKSKVDSCWLIYFFLVYNLGYQLSCKRMERECFLYTHVHTHYTHMCMHTQTH